MLDETPASNDDHTASGGDGPSGEAPAAPAKKAAAKKAPAKKAAAKKAPAEKAVAKKAPAKKAAAKKVSEAPVDTPAAEPAAGETPPAKKAAAKKAPAKKAAAKKAPAEKAPAKKASAKKVGDDSIAAGTPAAETPAAATGTALLFQPPEPTAPARRTRKAAAAPDSADGSTAEPADSKPAAKKAATKKTAAKKPAAQGDAPAAESTRDDQGGDQGDQGGERTRGQGGDRNRGQGRSEQDQSGQDGDDGEGGSRRRRRRGGRRRRKSGDGEGGSDSGSDSGNDSGSDDNRDDNRDGRDRKQGPNDNSNDNSDDGGGDGSSRRRRRRRRTGEDGDGGGDDPENTVTRVRKTRSAEDQITAVSGSTRLEAKKQRRREGREAGRRRAPIVSEAEFLARREAVDRVMAIRQRDDLTQIAVLEDKVLVEHYVARESQTSLIGNVYLGRVQNVLPSMEAAFIDIGKGRNAVLYAGEVNWSAMGHKDGQPRKIESVLSSGQPVLVQVTKDPIGHKGARLTSQISLAGRFLVYVPDGTTSGISRKLPDTERSRLKALLKEIVPDSAGVIVRTAAEGASEDELTRDVERLKARWEDIEKKSKGNAPQLLYGEPDLTLKVVRDLFTEDFSKLVIQGDEAWETVQGYVEHVAPDLGERLERYAPDNGKDIFAAYRIDEQIAKGLDRKVWLPSGGSLIIDRTEAMTVVDVNTGKFTGSGGNLEETVTKNNLEAAEEMVRQLRLRDIGGIIVIDFIDMVLESNRDLVLRRMVECLGRDRTRHQVAEVTSLGLVQMTRKRIGTGLLEAFSENCEHCQGRGLITLDEPVEPKKSDDDSRRSGGRRGRGRDRDGDDGGNGGGQKSQRGGGNRSDGGNKSEGRTNDGGNAPSPKDVAAMARHEADEAKDADAPTADPSPDKSGDTTAEKKSEAGSEQKSGQQRSRSTRSDRSRGRSGDTPTESTSDVPTEQPTAPDPEKKQAEKQAEKPAEKPETPAGPPEKPKVVTRTRSRGVTRTTTPTTTPVQPTTVAKPEPETPAEPAQPVPPAEKPKVVTRTRGRTAVRPAGPPTSAATDGGRMQGGSTSVGQVGAPPASGTVEPGTAEAEPGGGDAAGADQAPSTVEHVPIKKKGARKR